MVFSSRPGRSQAVLISGLGLSCAALATSLLAPLPPARAAEVAPGFQDTVELTGLKLPTNVAFAPDGRVFVNEKRGVIKVFDGLGDTTPDVVADLRTETFNASDSGLNGLALDPAFPARPYIYVSYQLDAPPGGAAPTYGTAGQDDDSCDVPDEGCVKAGRVAKLTLDGNRMVSHQVLLEATCQPTAAHAINDVQFGPDGALYVTAGEGASAWYADYGQRGNLCGDPPAPAGAAQSATTSEGGALRAQDARSTGDPLQLNGALARIHPDTGAGFTGNPYLTHSDPNMRRLVAFGMRNPFRFAFRPGSKEVYIGDVGWNTADEIDVVADVDDAVVENFGWPCYEGTPRQRAYDNLDNTLCESLYDDGSASPPFYEYLHAEPFLATSSCPANDAGSVSGLRFYDGGSFPPEYHGALFFVDYARSCLMVMKAGQDGRPRPSTLAEFSSARWPVDLEVGPDGALYYLDIYGGQLHRISYTSSNRVPTAALAAEPSSGPVGTTVEFDASGSRDPEGGQLTYSWDLDGDGTFGDAGGATARRTYTEVGRVTVAVQVTDAGGLSATSTLTVDIGAAPPEVAITVTEGSGTWTTGQRLSFAGSAREAGGSPIPSSALTWSSTLFHCEQVGCHPHPLSGGTGTAYSVVMPDHSAPAYLEVQLTARSSSGVDASTQVRLDPITTTLTLSSEPPGLQVGFDDEVLTTPATRPVIVGSQHSVSAADQTLDGSVYRFDSWSDGGGAAHNVLAGAEPATLVASFARAPATVVPGARDVDDSCPDSVSTATFADVPRGSPFARAVDCVWHWEIAEGTSATTYSPRAPVTRGQMAAFIARLVDRSAGALPAPTRDFFEDDSSSGFEDEINRLAGAGIVRGTTAGSYLPRAPVTRAEMAAFLTRAYDYRTVQAGGRALVPEADYFPDDDGYGLETAINTAATAGFTGGFADGTYGPGLPVRRDHMAAFLTRVLDLLVETGVSAVPPAPVR